MHLLWSVETKSHYGSHCFRFATVVANRIQGKFSLFLFKVSERRIRDENTFTLQALKEVLGHLRQIWSVSPHDFPLGKFGIVQL